MRNRNTFLVASALLLTGGATCTYDPSVHPENLRCHDNNGCPSEYRCVAGACCRGVCGLTDSGTWTSDVMADDLAGGDGSGPQDLSSHSTADGQTPIDGAEAGNSQLPGLDAADGTGDASDAPATTGGEGGIDAPTAKDDATATDDSADATDAPFTPGGTGGMGGAGGSGGAIGSGGTPGSGGAIGSGGAPGSGGITVSGGTTSTGGIASTGGATASGEAGGSGGATAAAVLSIDLGTAGFQSKVGLQTAATTLHVSNTGGRPTGNLSAALAGTNVDQFTITSAGCSTPLGVGQACAVALVCKPTAVGTFAASLVVSDASGAAASVMSALTCSGLGGAALTITGTTDFGQVVMGQLGQPLTFVVKNTGDLPSGKLSVNLSETQFLIQSEHCINTTLAKLATCKINIELGPTAEGTITGSLTVTGVDAPAASVELTGVGVRPAALTLSPGDLDFGWIAVGGVSTDQTITVKNTGQVATGTLSVSTLTNGFALSSSSTCSAALLPQQSCTLAFHFAPTVAGRVSTNVTVGDGTLLSSIYLGGSTVYHFKQVAVGQWHTCGLLTDNSVLCWGLDQSGRLAVPPGTYSQVSIGYQHACAIKISDGSVVCWGDAWFDQATPPTGVFSQISSSNYHNCGVRTDHTVGCSGCGIPYHYGQCTPPTGTFTQVSAGLYHTCGVKTNGTVACWGCQDGNDFGQCSPPSGVFSQVSAGVHHSCGVKLDGTVACWGCIGEDHGQCGIPTGPFSQVSAASTNTCGVHTNGTEVCWGTNDFGQCAQQSGTFSKLATAYDCTCGVKPDGTLACWGNNSNGQCQPP